MDGMVDSRLGSSVCEVGCKVVDEALGDCHVAVQE